MTFQRLLAGLFLALGMVARADEPVRVELVTSNAQPDAGFDVVALPRDRVLCAWITPSGEVMQSIYAEPDGTWFGALPAGIQGVKRLALLPGEAPGTLMLFTVEPGGRDGEAVFLRRSASEGARWDAPELVYEHAGTLTLGSAARSADGMVAVGIAEGAAADGTITRLLCGTGGADWRAATLGEGAAPDVVAPAASGFTAYFQRDDLPHRMLAAHSQDGQTWTAPSAVNLSTAWAAPRAANGVLPLSEDGLRQVTVTADLVTASEVLRVLFSWDGGRTWPVRRPVLVEGTAGETRLVRTETGLLHAVVQQQGRLRHISFSEDWGAGQCRIENPPAVANVTPPLELPLRRADGPALPLEDEPFIEHVRVDVDRFPVTAASGSVSVVQGDREWTLKDGRLEWRAAGSQEAFQPQPPHGLGNEGPLSGVVTAIAKDSRDTLWAATPVGLSARDAAGAWRHVRGREGLPWEDLTALAVAGDDLWIGSTRGLILYRPYATDRQWYYRAGPRYVPDDLVQAVAGADGKVYVSTPKGPGAIESDPVTLYQKAEYLEKRLIERHLRLGMPSPADYDDALAMDHWVHGPQPSDGLWTSYHVAAMSMAWSLTLDPRYRAAAKEGMEALYLLQNVTGIPGLVARSVVSVDEPAADRVRDEPSWHATADGKYLWRDDVSSDQIDGHCFAFYTYFEHIAQFDSEERAKLDRQIRQVTDYILEHDYQIPDWDGERTLWGWWDPVSLNNEPMHYLETGLYSLMMLSFLKTAHYVTGDEEYREHFQKLIVEHGYLSNLQLEKKLFPDELNHSDDQLSAVAFYPILQLERDPYIRNILHRAVRRHAFIEVPERNSLFAFVYASIDPADADVAGGLQTLREMPRDRRNWKMDNSHRADVSIASMRARGGDAVLHEVLPADERQFERWNQDPYEADGGGDGRNEGSGEHYILPYWLARYHGLIAAPGAS